MRERNKRLCVPTLALDMLGLLKALVRLLCGKQPPVEKPDYQPAPADYALLRSQAADEGDAMARCFEESHQAYSRGDGALAKELSNKGKQHQTCMQELNRQASECIFIGLFTQSPWLNQF